MKLRSFAKVYDDDYMLFDSDSFRYLSEERQTPYDVLVKRYGDCVITNIAFHDDCLFVYIKR